MVKLLHLLCFSLAILGALGKQLILIQQTFRHGARYPIFPYISNASVLNETVNNEGELTAEGKSMHYLLGKIIYQKYWMLLFRGTEFENYYNQTNFYVKSTDFNRTIESAQSHLFGLLEKLPKLQLSKARYNYSLPAWKTFDKSTNVSEIWDIFTTGSTFHPIPIHTQKRGANFCDSGDFLTKYDQASCPNQKFWIAENKASESNLQVQRDIRVKEAIQMLSKQVGAQVEFEDVFEWKDSQIALKFLSRPIPQIFTNPKYAKIYQFLNTYTMYMTLYSQQEQIKTVATSYFQQTLSNFLQHINNPYSPKIIIYSSHDTTIGMILVALNLVSAQCVADHYLWNGLDKGKQKCIWQYPPYSANAIFQLWEEKSDKNKEGKHWVKFVYNGKDTALPICGNKIECPLQEFKSWVDQFSVNNVNHACGFTGEANKYYAQFFLLGSAVIILVFYILFLHAKIVEIMGKGTKTRQEGEQGTDLKDI